VTTNLSFSDLLACAELLDEREGPGMEQWIRVYDEYTEIEQFARDCGIRAPGVMGELVIKVHSWDINE